MTNNSTDHPPRYSNREFPAYRFVPGKTPHPTRDPQGHSYNRIPEPLPPFDPQLWSACEEYLYGIDLFNHGYWWEAHEALEAVWVAAGRYTQTGQFVQGLIQIAVAHLKAHQEFYEVSRRMAVEGHDKMKAHRGLFMGIDLDRLREDVDRFCRQPDAVTIRIELAL